MMSAEGPYLSAIIARLPEPKFNLAAYGVAFSFALIIEAPIIMIMSASTALVKNYQSLIKLKNFTYTLNSVLTVIILVSLIPPVFDFIISDLMKLPGQISALTYKALMIMIPWPAAIGYRRFYQGILIRYNLTRRVAYGTVIRLAAMSTTALILFLMTKVDGVIVGACALSAGVVAEAAASKLMTQKIITAIKNSRERADYELSYRKILNFYYPLALTSIISLGVHPVVTFFMGQSRNSLESLAVLPVINSLVFIFRSVGLSFQEVGIALMGEKFEGYRLLKNFSIYGGITVVSLLGLIAFTPLSDLWLSGISGLSEQLSEFSELPLRIIFIMPGLTFWISYQRAVMVNSGNTKPITFATLIEAAGIILVLLILINYFNFIGVVAAMTAFIIGRLGANFYLSIPFNFIIRQKLRL